MTAQQIDPWGGVFDSWAPDPIRQRLADHTLEDVLALPTDAPRLELRDGVMLVVPSPTVDHQEIGYLLLTWLRANAPAAYRAVGAVGVLVNLKNTLELDVVLVRAPATGSHHYFTPDEVVIAVEVVSPSTRRRDRLEKPALYADAGVPFFWRVEQNPVHVHAYGLTVDGAYELLADSETELVVDEPFPIKLPIEAITP